MNTTTDVEVGTNGIGRSMIWIGGNIGKLATLSKGTQDLKDNFGLNAYQFNLFNQYV